MRSNVFLAVTLVSSSIFSGIAASTAVSSGPTRLDTALGQTHDLIRSLTKTLREIQAGNHSAADEARLQQEIAVATAGFNRAATEIAAAAAAAPAPVPIITAPAPAPTTSNSNSTSAGSAPVYGAPAPQFGPGSLFSAPAPAGSFTAPIPSVAASAPAAKTVVLQASTTAKQQEILKSATAMDEGSSDDSEEIFVPGTKRVHEVEKDGASKLARSESNTTGATSAAQVQSSQVTQMKPSSSASPAVGNVKVDGNVILARLQNRLKGANSSSPAVAAIKAASPEAGPAKIVPNTYISANAAKVQAQPKAQQAAPAPTQIAAPASGHTAVIDQLAAAMGNSGTFMPRFFEIMAQNDGNAAEYLKHPSSNGQSLFEIAIRSGNNAVAGLLVGAGAYSVTFKNGESVLLFAVNQKNTELVRTLLGFPAFQTQVNFVVLGAAAATPTIAELVKPFSPLSW